MSKHPDVPDRWTAMVTPDMEGAWTFAIHAWSDPVGTWPHAAGIKIPAEIDTELMFTEGRLMIERVLAALPPDAPDDADADVATVRRTLPDAEQDAGHTD